MSKTIFLKSIRSLWRQKKSYIACIAVLAIGMAVFIGMLSASKAVDVESDKYFIQSSFADAFAVVDGIPQSSIDSLKQIDGIKDVEGELVQNFNGIMPNEELFGVTLIGLDLSSDKRMNKLLYTGSKPVKSNDILVSKSFLDANKLSIGDKISIIINSKIQDFYITGASSSPEYLISNFNLDQSKSAVAYINLDTLVDLVNNQVYTNISFKFDKDIKFINIEKSITYALKNYGVLSLYDKADQFSYNNLKRQSVTLASIATTIPVIFLFISIIMLYIMLKKSIEQERSQIGTLKAYGYRDNEIKLGYFFYGVVIGSLGFLFALLGGLVIGDNYFNMIVVMFNIPNAVFSLSRDILITAFLMSITVSLLAVFLGANNITKIHPAQAMKAEVPVVSASSLKLKSKIFTLIFNSSGMMGIRGILRSKKRTMLTVISIVMCFALINTLFAFSNSYNTVLGSIVKSELYDLKVTYNGFQPFNKAINDIKQYADAKQIEASLVIPVTYINKNITKDSTLTGRVKNSQLEKILNDKFSEENINGLTINTNIAKELQVREGDFLEVECAYLKQNKLVMVSKIVKEPFSSSTYMTIDDLNKFLGESNVINTVVFNVPKEKILHLEKNLKYFEGIKSVDNKQNTADQIISQSGGTTGLLYMLIIMSFFMCFGVIYNVSSISMAEKERELATMRIHGFTVNETAEVNDVEHYILLIIGCIIGFFFSLPLRDGMEGAFSSPDFSIVINLSVESVISAFIACIVAVILSNFMAKKQISKYQLVEVLKERA